MTKSFKYSNSSNKIQLEINQINNHSYTSILNHCQQLTINHIIQPTASPTLHSRFNSSNKIQVKINQIINSITYSRPTSMPATHEQSMHPTGCLNYPYYLQSLSFYSNHSFYFLRSSHYSFRVLLQQTLFSKFPIPTISTSNVSSPWQQRPKIRPTAS